MFVCGAWSSSSTTHMLEILKPGKSDLKPKIGDEGEQ